MKKIMLLISLLFCLFLIGCLGSEVIEQEGYTNEEILKIIEDGLDTVEIEFETGETLKSILSDVVLPTSTKAQDEELTISWDSSNESVITNSGTVTPDNNERTDVILTASITFEGETDSKSFEATVLEFDSENVEYSRALQYFRNSSFAPIDALPESITESDNYIAALSLVNCTNESDLDSYYEDDCFSNDTTVNTQSDAYEDILEVLNAFTVIKQYTTLAEDVITDVDGDLARNVTIAVPGYGKLKVLNTGTATDNSYTFSTEVEFTTTAGVSLSLTIQNELSFDETTNEFTARYTFDIQAGFSYFNVSAYTLSAEVTTDAMFELTSLEVGSEILIIGSKMTKLTVNEDASIELYSYRQNLVLSDYKSYIYANDEYGTSYYWTSGNPLNPFSGEKSSFEIFTPEAKLYELNLKGGANEDDEGAAKFYFSGIDGYDRVEVNKPSFAGFPTGKWEFKLTSSTGHIIHKNESAGDAEFRIEREDAYQYVDSFDTDGNLVGYEREKTGEDVFYVAVYNNDLYALPKTLTDFGITTQVANIETIITKTENRLTSLEIMGSNIFETPRQETGGKITITIPGINKEITL